MNPEQKTPGQTGFEAYSATTNWLTYDGKPIPPWVNLNDRVRNAWETAAKAILEKHGKEQP